MPFISSSIVNGDVRECSVMWLSVILAFDVGVLSCLCHLAKVGEPPDQLSPCIAVEAEVEEMMCVVYVSVTKGP